MASGKVIILTSAGDQVAAKSGDTITIPSGTTLAVPATGMTVGGTALDTHISNQVGSAARVAFDVALTSPTGGLSAGDFVLAGSPVTKASKTAAEGRFTGYVRANATAGASAAVAPAVGVACASDGTPIDFSELNGATIGDEVFLGASGRPTLSTPSTAGDYVRRLGIVHSVGGSAGQLYLQPEAAAVQV